MVVLRSFPGGDPLAAAMAAGETPSPELVAAAGGRGELSVRAAWSVLALMVLAAIFSAVLQQSTRIHHLVQGIRAPDGLAERAAEIAAKFAGAVRDREGWLTTDTRQLAWLSRTHPRARDWQPILNARRCLSATSIIRARRR